MSLRFAPAAFGVAACLVLAEPLSAQTQDEGARERPDLVTRPELAVGFALDVIRQGLQIGDVARIGDLLGRDYTDRQPDGSMLSSEALLASLHELAEAAQALPRPQGLDQLGGLYDFQWVGMELEFQPDSVSPASATVRVTGWSSATGRLTPALLQMKSTGGGWVITNSEGMAAMVAAILQGI